MAVSAESEAAETVIRSRRYHTTEDYLAIDELKVDYEYHRKFDESHARKMLAEAGGEYVEEVGRYILVSRREDGDYIIVGLHRSRMAAMAGQDLIPAVIIHGISAAQEAELARIESARRKESPIDQFRQELVAGHKEAVEIVRIVERNGARVARHRAGRVRTAGSVFDAIGTLRAVYRRDDGKTLNEALAIMHDAWDHTPADAALLRGMSDFLTDKGHLKIGLDRKRLVQSIGREGLVSLSRQARDLKPMDAPLRVGYFRALVMAYNRGRRSARLPQPWR